MLTGLIVFGLMCFGLGVGCTLAVLLALALMVLEWEARPAGGEDGHQERD